MRVICALVYFIYGIYGGSDTCCYGKECPLPIFNEYVANWTWIMDQNVISNSACCPSGGSGNVHRYSDLTSACICTETQTCPSYDSIDAIGCSNGELCPDSNFNGVYYNFTNGYIVNGESYCVYTPDDAPTRGMSQRCPDQSICYYGRNYNTEDPYAGTYNYVRLYNGFAAYKHSDLWDNYRNNYIAVIADWTCNNCKAKWSVTSGEPWGGRSFYYLSDPTEFGDVASIDGIESGDCPFVPTKSPTTNPTKQLSQIPTENTNQSSSKNGLILEIVIVAVVGLLILVVIVGLYLWWRNKNTKVQNDEYQLSIQ